MRIEITLKNYRCFPDSEPARFVVADDWTAFVGVNNAGKSSLLRFFFEFRHLFGILANFAHWVSLLRGEVLGFQYPDSVRDPHEVLHNQNTRPLLLEIRVVRTFATSGVTALERVTLELARDEPRRLRMRELQAANGNVVSPHRDHTQSGEFVVVHHNVQSDIGGYVEAMRRLQNTLYVGAFRNVLNTGTKSNYFDIQVGEAFVTRWRQMKTGNSKRSNQACEDVTAVIERLFRFDRLEIHPADSNDTLQLVINRKHYMLTEVGAGIAQFVLVLVNAAFVRPAYVLIDEPELNLHPSLQLDFLSALGGFAEHGMLFSTHSIGLARSAADRIYSVKPLDHGVSQVRPYEATLNLPEFLGEMNYSSYHAMGFSKVLLVEGPTEVRTMQQFLRKLGKDQHVLLLSLGGRDFINPRRDIELAELMRITSSIKAVIDSERTAAGAALSAYRQGFKDLCDKSEIPCYVLDWRTTENYLSERAIQRVKGGKYRKLGPFEDLAKVTPNWAKNENWRIASEMTWDEVKDTDLGKFLATL